MVVAMAVEVVTAVVMKVMAVEVATVVVVVAMEVEVVATEAVAMERDRLALSSSWSYYCTGKWSLVNSLILLSAV